MVTLRESFGLMEYSEEFIEKIIDYRMHPDKQLNRYLDYEENTYNYGNSVDLLRQGEKIYAGKIILPSGN